jgi:hypothetical protein
MAKYKLLKDTFTTYEIGGVKANRAFLVDEIVEGSTNPKDPKDVTIYTDVNGEEPNWTITQPRIALPIDNIKEVSGVEAMTNKAKWGWLIGGTLAIYGLWYWSQTRK